MAKLQELGPHLQTRGTTERVAADKQHRPMWILLDVAVQKVNSKKRKVEAGISLGSQVRDAQGLN